MNASTIVFTLAKFNQSTKYMLKVAKEITAKGTKWNKTKTSKFKLNNKAPERRQRYFGIQIYIK